VNGTQVHVWPNPGHGTFPPGPCIQKGDVVHIAPHKVHGIDVCCRCEEDITVTGVVPMGDAVLVCGRCADGACRAVAYDVDAVVERLDVAA
jgi:hypothetical protein